MSFIGMVPRRCVNLPPGALGTLLRCVFQNSVLYGDAVDLFYQRFAKWLGVPYVFGTGSGRSSFQLALESLDLDRGAEIIFPVFTFPVMPLVARLLGYRPVFCDVDPQTFNSGPEHIAPHVTDRTGAILATHLFGQPCPIREIVSLARQRRIRVMEDCAHACGVRIDGKQVGTFGDIGIFSFAEGKNMPCFGGGAIVTADTNIAHRAQAILSKAPTPARGEVVKNALDIWIKWLLTRPAVFGVTVYPVLRLKLLLGRSLMDSSVGDELLQEFGGSLPPVRRFTNLQASIGLLQLDRVDAFNEGARANAQLLTDELGQVPGISAPRAAGPDHIYVYYPLTVEPITRDQLRHHLLKTGIDSKTTDMANCTLLEPFRESAASEHKTHALSEASILEICVYPVIPREKMPVIAREIRAWAGLA